ncbi:hypothetical protein DFH27DRAFT_321630 [Peziza echinospora]|nr:hypothetical protein DFH27DRAFT_321630 [Peziza echinospora]
MNEKGKTMEGAGAGWEKESGGRRGRGAQRVRRREMARGRGEGDDGSWEREGGRGRGWGPGFFFLSPKFNSMLPCPGLCGSFLILLRACCCSCCCHRLDGELHPPAQRAWGGAGTDGLGRGYFACARGRGRSRPWCQEPTRDPRPASSQGKKEGPWPRPQAKRGVSPGDQDIHAATAVEKRMGKKYKKRKNEGTGKRNVEQTDGCTGGIMQKKSLRRCGSEMQRMNASYSQGGNAARKVAAVGRTSKSSKSAIDLSHSNSSSRPLATG